jgi:hypothetical protein
MQYVLKLADPMCISSWLKAAHWTALDRVPGLSREEEDMNDTQIIHPKPNTLI